MKNAKKKATKLHAWYVGLDITEKPNNAISVNKDSTNKTIMIKFSAMSVHLKLIRMKVASHSANHVKISNKFIIFIIVIIGEKPIK